MFFVCSKDNQRYYTVIKKENKIVYNYFYSMKGFNEEF